MTHSRSARTGTSDQLFVNDSKTSERITTAWAMRAGSSRTLESNRTNGTDERIVSPSMDLILYGSPAPRCPYRSRPIRSKNPKQPPNTPSALFKERKPLQLPIDKIVMLSERLRNDNSDKIRVELSSRQIKLQDSDRSNTHTRREEPKFKNPEKFSDISSSSVDLSIDLSTVTSSDHESVSSSEEIDEFVSRSRTQNQRRSYSTSSCTESPTHYTWHAENRLVNAVPGEREESSGTSYPYSRSSKESIALASDSPALTSRSASAQDKALSVMSSSSKCSRSRSADLIYVYVNTVNNSNELIKYFRPCHACNKPCCVCPDVDPGSARSCSVYSCTSSKCIDLKNVESSKPEVTSRSLRNSQGNVNRTTETDPEITEFYDILRSKTTGSVTSRTTGDKLADESRDSYDQSRSESRNSEFSSFLADRYLNKTYHSEYEMLKDHQNNDPELVFDSGNSTLQLDDVNDSESYSPSAVPQGKPPKSVNLSVMQLATAAQCARILANSLESVLELVDNEDEDSFQSKDLVKFTGEDLNKLFESVTSLKFQVAEFNGQTAKDDSKPQKICRTASKEWMHFDSAGHDLDEKRLWSKEPFQSSSNDEQKSAFQNSCFEDNFDEQFF